MPWEAHAWHKLIWWHKFVSQDLPCLNALLLLCTHRHVHQFLPTTTLPKVSTLSRGCSSLFFTLQCHCQPLPPHHMFLISSPLSSLWSLKSDSWNYLLLLEPLFCLSRSDCIWYALLSSGTRPTPVSEGKSVSSFPALIYSMSWCCGLLETQKSAGVWP